MGGRAPGPFPNSGSHISRPDKRRTIYLIGDHCDADVLSKADSYPKRIASGDENPNNLTPEQQDKLNRQSCADTRKMRNSSESAAIQIVAPKAV